MVVLIIHFARIHWGLTSIQNQYRCKGVRHMICELYSCDTVSINEVKYKVLYNKYERVVRDNTDKLYFEIEGCLPNQVDIVLVSFAVGVPEGKYKLVRSNTYTVYVGGSPNTKDYSSLSLLKVDNDTPVSDKKPERNTQDIWEIWTGEYI